MNPIFIRPNREEFWRHARFGNMIPVYTELVSDCETPVSAFQKLSGEECCFLLESAERKDQTCRFSFLGVQPALLIESIGSRVTITDRGQVTEFESDDPLGELKKLMQRYRPVKVIDEIPFCGGAVGYFAYDMVQKFEPSVPSHPKDELGLPDMLFMVADTLLIFDHRYRQLKIVANALIENNEVDSAYDAAVERIREILERLAVRRRVKPINTLEPISPVQVSANTEKAEFLQMVRDAKEHIRAGDIFQVVLSQRFETKFSYQPTDLYRCLRYINPSPYMFCLHFPGRFSLVGSSPETHVRSIDGKVEIRPIAGTRPRGKTQEEDDAHAQDLLADPKERAEHIMLVDLARNDVGRISEYGSVKVSDFMIVERYSHVMHIVSHVTGKLRSGCDAYDVFRATFPAGTVSGSPKVRAMQIISELEKSKRCAYSGAVGYFGFDGNHDSCITLRSVVIQDGKVYAQAGAGIVADSMPENEYQECVNKAMAVMRAIEQCQQMHESGS